MRVTSKGRVTIPQKMRERFGFLPGTEVDFVVRKNTVQIVKSRRSKPTRGETIVRRLRGSATVAMSTDEILARTRK